jgi:hypothetical protein
MPIVKDIVDLTVNPQNAISGITALAVSMTGLYKLATGLAVAFAGISIVDKTFTSMKTAEASILKLKTALQSATAGVADYERAVKFAAQTPFPVESVVQAAVALRAFQTDPFAVINKSGTQLITVLGDMAGAMGQDLTTATLAFTRALQGEWEIMDNNFQINRRSIPKLQALTVGTKAYKDELIKFISEQKRFQGGMEAMSKSLTGMMSNMADAIDLVFMGIAGVADSEARLKGLTLFDSVKNSIRELYDAVSASSPFEIFADNMKKLDESTLGLDVDGLTAKIDVVGTKLRGLMLDPVKNREAVLSVQKDLDNLIARKDLLSTKKGQLSSAFVGLTPKGKDGNPRGKDETLNYLVAQTKSAKEQSQIVDQFMNQGEKLMLLGRIIGQFFKMIFDTTIGPIISAAADGIEALLNQGQKLMSAVIPFNAFGASVLKSYEVTDEFIKNSTDKTSSYVESTLFGVSQNVHDILRNNMANMFVSEKEFMDLGSIYVQTTSQRDRDAIEMRFLSSKSVLEKQMMIFVIIMNIIGVIIKNNMKKIFEYFGGLSPYMGRMFTSIKNGLFLLIGAFLKAGKAFWDGFGPHIYRIRAAFGELLEAVGSIFEKNAKWFDTSTTIFGWLLTVVGYVTGAVITLGIEFLKVALYIWNWLSVVLPIIKWVVILFMAAGAAVVTWYVVMGILGFVTDGVSYAWRFLRLQFLKAKRELIKFYKAHNLGSIRAIWNTITEAVMRGKATAVTMIAKGANDLYNKSLAATKVLLGPIGWAILAVVAAVGLLTYVWEEYGDSITSVLSVAWDSIKNIYNALVEVAHSTGIDIFLKIMLGLIAAIVIVSLPLTIPFLKLAASIGVVIAAAFIMWEVLKGMADGLAAPFNLVIDIISEIFGEMTGGTDAIDGATESSISFASIWESIKAAFEMIKPALQVIGEIITFVLIYPLMFSLRIIQSIVYGFKYGWTAALIPIKEIFADIAILAEKLMNALGGDFSFGTDFKKKLAEEKAAVGVKGKGDKGWENTLAGKIDAGKEKRARTKDFESSADEYDKREFDRAKMPDHTLPLEEEIAGLKFEELAPKGSFELPKNMDFSKASIPGLDFKDFAKVQAKQVQLEEIAGLKFEELAPKGSFELPKNMDFSKASIPGLDSKDFAKVQAKQVQLAGKMATADSKYYRDSVAVDKQIEINTRDLKKTNSVASNNTNSGGVPGSGGRFNPATGRWEASNALGEWMVPADMPASLHKNEMVIPAKESAAIRELFGQSTSGRMQGTDVFNNLANKKNQGATAKINNITITQTFNGKQTAQAGTQMKSAASELAVKLTVLGD